MIHAWVGLSEWPNQDECFDVSYFVPLDGNEDLSDLETALKKGATEADREQRESFEIVVRDAAEFVK